MKPRDRGVVVQVGSALAYRSIPLQSAYCAAKHAVKGFTESVRTELIHDESHVKITLVELPALNTPQFDWARSRMPRRAQPIPPIFQPEVAAEATVYASLHPRREMLVGWPTRKAVLAEKIAPGIADWVLGRRGYAAQQTREKARLGRKDNLFSPLPGDRGAHGRFDDRAAHSSLTLWVSLNRRLLALALLALGSAVIGGVVARRRLTS
jgi:NAD(P)-dependent dehydrogenase (short-subunit alcohol dehydrogenase family)